MVGLLKKPSKTLNANKMVKNTSSKKPCQKFEFPVAARAVPAGAYAAAAAA